MTRYDVKGELQLEGVLAHGWCWSPERARERLTVELLMDGTRVGASVAARLRLDLVQDGSCDGYHGFSLALPKSDGAYAVLEAREAGTGQIFGRRVGKIAAPVDWLTRTAALQQQFHALHAAVPHYPRANPRGLQALMPPVLPAGFRLPVIDNPQFSLVIDAISNSTAALAGVVALAPLLRSHAVELVVVDNGRGSASAALASLDGLSYVLLREDDLVTRLNWATQRARGHFIVIFDPHTPSLRDIVMLLDQCLGSCCVVLGHAMVIATQNAGLRELQTAKLMHRPANFAAIAVPAGIFHAMSGFNPGLCADLGLAALDFTIRGRFRRLQSTDTRSTPTAAAPHGEFVGDDPQKPVHLAGGWRKRLSTLSPCYDHDAHTPNPPPPGVRMLNTSPGAISTCAAKGSSSRAPD